MKSKESFTIYTFGDRNRVVEALDLSGPHIVGPESKDVYAAKSIYKEGSDKIVIEIIPANKLTVEHLRDLLDDEDIPFLAIHSMDDLVDMEAKQHNEFVSDLMDSIKKGDFSGCK